MHNELCNREVARYRLASRRISLRSMFAMRRIPIGIQGSSASWASMACLLSALMTSRWLRTLPRNHPHEGTVIRKR